MYPSFLSRFNIRAVAGVLLITGIGGYVLFEASRYLEGPRISLEYPREDTLTEDRLIELRATTKNVASISVNGRETYITEDGFLKEQILLPRGYTVLTLAAKDRFGHETKESLELYTH